MWLFWNTINGFSNKTVYSELQLTLSEIQFTNLNYSWFVLKYTWKRCSLEILTTVWHICPVFRVPDGTPDGLQRKLFHVISYELAWRRGEGSSCLIHNFHEERDHNGFLSGRIEYNPIFTKTCQGGSKKLSDSKWLTTNKESPDVCPVR